MNAVNRPTGAQIKKLYSVAEESTHRKHWEELSSLSEPSFSIEEGISGLSQEKTTDATSSPVKTIEFQAENAMTEGQFKATLAAAPSSASISQNQVEIVVDVKPSCCTIS